MLDSSPGQHCIRLSPKTFLPLSGMKRHRSIKFVGLPFDKPPSGSARFGGYIFLATLPLQRSDELRTCSKSASTVCPLLRSLLFRLARPLRRRSFTLQCPLFSARKVFLDFLPSRSPSRAISLSPKVHIRCMPLLSSLGIHPCVLPPASRRSGCRRIDAFFPLAACSSYFSDSMPIAAMRDLPVSLG